MFPNPYEQLYAELQAIRKEQAELKSLLGATPPSLTSEIIDRGILMARLRVTEPTIIRHEKRGLIPFLTIGTAKRYNWPEVVKALENKKAKK